jgi:endonuclease III-like uncharacterized protein
MEALPAEAPLFNEYHAQIVMLAKEACRARPECAVCPLDDLCPKVGLASRSRRKTLTGGELEAR